VADGSFFFILDAINCRVLLAALRELGIPHALRQTVDVSSREALAISIYFGHTCLSLKA